MIGPFTFCPFSLSSTKQTFSFCVPPIWFFASNKSQFYGHAVSAWIRVKTNACSQLCSQEITLPAHTIPPPCFAEDFVPRDQTRQDTLFSRDKSLTTVQRLPCWELLPCSANYQHTVHEVLSLFRFHHTWPCVWYCRGVVGGALISRA